MLKLWSGTEFFSSTTRKLIADKDIYSLEGNGLDLYLKRNFLSPDECEHLRNLIDEENYPSTVMGPQPRGDFRTSDSSALGRRNDPLVHAVDERISALTGIPRLYGEGIEGQRYFVGREFKPHCDYFPMDQEYWPREAAIGGQRTWTVMIWLNQPEAGGGTLFPEAGIRLHPRGGSLLAWCNLDAAGRPNPNSLHCGEPVVAGSKYILTKWHRERAFTPLAPCILDEALQPLDPFNERGLVDAAS
jgi:prolyl 4-hydroxylase